MQSRVAVSMAVAAVALMAMSGCSSMQERFTPGPKVVTKEATVAVDGARVMGDLSKNTPDGLPLWPGATVTESTGTDQAYGLSLTTTDPYDDVLNGVAAGFEDAGWTVTREETGGEETRSVILTVASESLQGFVTLTEIGDGTTQVDYTIARAQ